MLRPARAAGAIVLAAVLLSGCSAQPTPTTAPTAADDSQSVADACAQMAPALATASSEIHDAVESLKADPSGAPALVRQVSTDLRAEIATLRNDDVSSVMTDTVDALDAMADEIDKTIAGTGHADELASAGVRVQTEFQLVNTVCAT